MGDDIEDLLGQLDAKGYGEHVYTMCVGVSVGVCARGCVCVCVFVCVCVCVSHAYNHAHIRAKRKPRAAHSIRIFPVAKRGRHDVSGRGHAGGGVGRAHGGDRYVRGAGTGLSPT